MGRQLKQLLECPDLVDRYAAAFANEPQLKKAGLLILKFYKKFT